MFSDQNNHRLAWLVTFSLCASPYLRVGTWDHGRITDVLAPFLFLMALQRSGWSAFRAWLPGILMLAILSWNALALWAGPVDLWPGLGYLAKRAEAFALCAAGFALARRGLPPSAVESGVRWGSGFVALSVVAEMLLTAPPWRCAGLPYSGQVVQTGLVLLCGISLAGKRAGLLGLLLAATLLTGTRSVLIGLLIVVAVLAAREALVRYTLVALLSIWLLAPAATTGRLTSFEGELLAGLQAAAGNSTAHSSLSDRIVAAQQLVQTDIVEAPWLGHGTGALRLGLCDNFWVTECIYHGIPGALLWVALLLTMGRQLWRISQRHVQAKIRRLARLSLMWLGLLSLNSLTSESFYLLRPTELVFWFIGVTAGVARGQLPDRSTAPPWWPLVGSLLLCLLPWHMSYSAPLRAFALEALGNSSELLTPGYAVRLSVKRGELRSVGLPALNPVILQLPGPPASVETWSQLAKAFCRDDRVLGYSLFCDNHTMSVAAWKEYSSRVVRAIRAAGSHQWIYVAGARQASAQDWTEIHETAAWIEDPERHTAYEALLSLCPNNDSGTFLTELAREPELPSLPLRRLQPFAQWCVSNGSSGSVTILPFPPEPGWNDQLDSTLDELDRLAFGCTVSLQATITDSLVGLTLPVLERHRLPPAAVSEWLQRSRMWTRRQLYRARS